MAYQYPYVKVLVTDDTDFVLDAHLNTKENQIFELTEALKLVDDAYPTGAELAGHAGEYLKVNPGETAFEYSSSLLGSHGPTHEDGAGDEIDVTGLSGVLGDTQNPVNHASDHEAGGSDEVDITAGSVDIVKFSAHKNSSGTIARGKCVYLVGYHVAHAQIHVEKAKSDAMATMPTLGILEDDITELVVGNVVITGRITGLDTSMWNERDMLYPSAATAGELTNVKPTGTNLIQKVACVARKDASDGIIIVFGAGRSNDIPNLPDGEIWMGNGSGVAQAVSFLHAALHENGGADEMNVGGLNGVLVDLQPPSPHAGNHEVGGSDVMSLLNLTGLAATPQTPAAHKSNHLTGGGDPFGSGDVIEALVKRVQDAGGQNMDIAILDDEAYVKRSGSTLDSAGFFGQNQQDVADATTSTTTSTTPQQKLRLTTPSLPAGRYRIGWKYSWYFTSTANDFYAQIEVDDTTIIGSQVEEPTDVGTGQERPESGYAYINLTAAAHTIDLDFARVGVAGTAGIFNTSLEIWRVS